MEIEDKLNYVFRKITKDEFDRLHDLFPDNEQMWLKYRDMRLKEFENKEIDVYVIERYDSFIGDALNPEFSRVKRSRCRSSQEVNDSPTPFSAINYC